MWTGNAPLRPSSTCSLVRISRAASTITQQLIKNLTQYDDVTVKRKVIEIFRALQFDKDYTKETTLEWYLNFSGWGTAVGV